MALEGPRRFLAQYGSPIGGILGGIGGAYFGNPQLGAGIGSTALGGLGQLLNPGSPQQQQQASPFMEAQQEMLEQLRQPVQGVDIGALQQLAQRNFQENIVPGIAERFSGVGGQRSGAFGQQLGTAGARLATDIAGLGPQYQLAQQRLDKSRLDQLSQMLGQQQKLAQRQQEFGARQQSAGAQRQAEFINNLIDQFIRYSAGDKRQQRGNVQEQQRAQTIGQATPTRTM